MKSIIQSAIIAVVLASWSSMSFAEKIDPDRNVVTVMMINLFMDDHCSKEYENVPEALVRYGDSIGGNLEVVLPATFNAYEVNMGKEYDRKWLVPRITKYVLSGLLEMNKDLNSLGREGFCREYGKTLVKLGLIKERKK